MILLTIPDDSLPPAGSTLETEARTAAGETTPKAESMVGSWVSAHRGALARAAIAIVMLLCLAGMIWIATIPWRGAGEQETLLLGQPRLIAGAPGGVRVLVRNLNTDKPVPGAQVDVGVQSRAGGAQMLYTGRTDAYGTADVHFQVPEDMPYESELVIQTRSRLGRDWVVHPMNMVSDVRLFLTTDKPVYQPGQTIHMRVLALRALTLKPLQEGAVVDLLVQDGDGNKVFRQSVGISGYGIASADFALATEVNQGSYAISAECWGATADKTVEVKWYVLPKFQVTITPDKPFYRLNEIVRGRVQADYFYGKPVAEAEVVVTGVVYDPKPRQVAEVRGRTDAEGGMDFKLQLPGQLSGSDQDRGTMSYMLEVSVTDVTEHVERKTQDLVVASGALVIDAMPESGMLQQGVENILYILTSYPNGAPAQASVEIEYQDEILEMESGEHGVVEWRVKPDAPALTFTVLAKDPTGRFERQTMTLQAEGGASQVLLRPDRPLYRVGEAMHLLAWVKGDAAICYLDVLKEGQTLAMRAAPVRKGQAAFDLDLSPDLMGTLELHAYQVDRNGKLVGDTRLVVVQPASEDLQVALTMDRDTYKPGDVAKLAFQLSHQGKPVQGALGLSIVDESVFSVQDQDPGYLRLFFVLEAELLKPGYTVMDTIGPDLMVSLKEAKPEAQVTPEPGKLAASHASLAKVPGRQISLLENSRSSKENRLGQRRSRLYGVYMRWLGYGSALLPLLVVGLVASQFRRRISIAWPTVRSSLIWLLPTVLLSLGAFAGLLVWSGIDFESGLVVAMVLAAIPLLIGMVGFAGHARRTGNQDAGLVAWLLLAQLVLLVLVAIMMYDAVPSRSSMTVMGASYLVGSLAILALGVGLRHVEQDKKPNFGALLGISLGVVAVVMLLLALVMLTGCQPKIVEVTKIVEKEVVVEKEKVVKETVVVSPQPTAAPAQVADTSLGPRVEPPPRLRQYFPETLYWNPEAITDESGKLDLELTLADSITTWRLSAQANTQDGALGGATAGLRVFQDFFVDLDLPVSLTQNDEISVPVNVFNYLAQAQVVRLEVTQEEWFDLLSPASQQVTVGPNEAQNVQFRLRARDFGTHRLTVTAWGDKMSDALAKEVRVVPDGLEVNGSRSDWLEDGASGAVSIPPEAITGTAKLYVKVYPGPYSQVVEGLDSILRMPSGCFEQTSSSAYPNVLVLDYLNRTGRVSQEVQRKAERYVAAGYQRLLTFEVPGGGFSLFGHAPASVPLTAYGLLEFHDMAQVYPVDPALIERTANWLLRQQRRGGWGDRSTNAFVVWALAEAGYAQSAEVQPALAGLRAEQALTSDPYSLALIANALVAAHDPAAEEAIEHLSNTMTTSGGAYWVAQGPSIMGSHGLTGNLEATALAIYANLRSGQFNGQVRQALAYLIQQKDPYGTWYNTQATILSLKALLAATGQEGVSEGEGQVVFSLNGAPQDPIRISEQTADVVHTLILDQVQPGENAFSFHVAGTGNLMYQVTAEYWLPWNKVPAEYLANQEMALEVLYDRTHLAVNEVVNARARVVLRSHVPAMSVLVQVGVPPGFAVETADLEQLVADGVIRRYEFSGQDLYLYLEDMQPRQLVDIPYRLRAKFALKAAAPGASAYDYYNPSVQGLVAPVLFVVE